MPVAHSTVVVVADDGTSPVGTDEWNAAHGDKYRPTEDVTLIAGSTSITQTDPFILDSGRLVTLPDTALLWLDTITPPSQFAQQDNQPSWTESLLTGYETVVQTDPLIVDDGVLLTIPQDSVLWTDAPRATPEATGLPVNILKYGADPTGTIDSTDAIRKAMAATPNGGELLIPNGRFLVSGTGNEIFLRTTPITIKGQGIGSVILMAASIGASTDIFRFAPQSSSDAYFWRCQQFVFRAVSGTPGRHAFELDTSISGVFLQETLFEHIYNDPMGSHVIHHTDPTNANGGVFELVIRNCLFTNGIQLTNCGDNITIMDNVIDGPQWGVEIDGVASAQQYRIMNNVMVCDPGMVWIRGGNFTTCIIAFNQFEQQTTNTGTNNCLVDIDGTAAKNISNVVIFGNTITGSVGTGNPNAIRVNFATNCYIAANRLASQVAHILITANATQTYIGPANQYYGAGAHITDSGSQSNGYFDNQLIGLGGGLSLPAFGFAGSKNTGMDLSVGGVINFASSGAASGRIDSTGVGLIDGGASAPSLNFIGENTTGLSRIVPGGMGLSSLGLEIARTSSTEGFRLAAGINTRAPLTFVSGTNLSTAAAGALEFDGTALYTTNDTTNGRRYNDSWNYFRLTGSGTGITGIADFFGANDGIPLVANGVYEIEWHCYFSQVTAGTATWTIVTATTALANLTGEYIGSPIGGIGAVGTPQTAAINVTSSSSTAFPVTGTEATAVTHYFIVRVLATAGNGASNTRLRLTMGAGTATPLINSFFRVRRLAGANVGTFVA